MIEKGKGGPWIKLSMCGGMNGVFLEGLCSIFRDRFFDDYDVTMLLRLHY